MQSNHLPTEAKTNAIKAIEDLRDFALSSFESLDSNQDGFLSHYELEQALKAPGLTAKDAAFLNFLLVRLVEIGNSHHVELPNCITKEDLNVYFAKLLSD